MHQSEHKRRMCIMCTHSFTLATLYKGVLPFLESHGYEIHVVVGDREYNNFDPVLFGRPRISVIPMSRLPTPYDIISLVRVVFFFCRNRFEVIHMSTPKASLLGSIAARLTYNGRTVFVNRRRVYERMSGWKRKLFTAVDRFICKRCDIVVPVSKEMGAQLVSEGICSEERLRILGHGSSNGIDTERFSLNDEVLKKSRELRVNLSIPSGAPVLLFVGRVCKEKGVDHFVSILRLVRQAVPEVHLIIAGPDDPRDPISAASGEALAADSGVHRLGFVTDPRPLYACADIFVFPSFFEGLPNVLLEAAAMEKPAVCFDVPGVRETVEHGVSGYLAPFLDDTAMADSITCLLRDSDERSRVGRQARERVMNLFSREVTWESLLAVLNELIAAPQARTGSKNFTPTRTFGTPAPK